VLCGCGAGVVVDADGAVVGGGVCVVGVIRGAAADGAAAVAGRWCWWW